jgi:hypothetical protein
MADLPPPVVLRLRDGIAHRDLDVVVGCFREDYRNETPLHPSRSFSGRAQVRKNWTQILAAVPDLLPVLVRSCTDAEATWVEWEWTGTKSEGSPLLMRGVTVLGIIDGLVAWSRFYLEPVEVVGDGVDEAVRAGLT